MDPVLVTIAKFRDNFEADLAREFLADNGIQAFLQNELVYSMLPGILPGKFDIELQVASSDEAHARELLAQQQNTPEIRNILIANGAILNELPMDVLGQLTREEGPAYTAQRMLGLAGPAGQPSR